MTTPPPRKFSVFQFHLSTAMVMMFIAGVLMWLNLTPNVIEWQTWEGKPVLYGWPFKSYFLSHVHIPDRFGGFEIIFDFVIAIVILFASYRLCEWQIRRRAVRK